MLPILLDAGSSGGGPRSVTRPDAKEVNTPEVTEVPRGFGGIWLNDASILLTLGDLATFNDSDSSRGPPRRGT